MKKNKLIIFKIFIYFICTVAFFSLLTATFLIKLSKKPVDLKYYDIANYETNDPILKEISAHSLIDSKGTNMGDYPYLAHPDILAIEKSSTETLLLNYYVDGHGRGPTRLKKATFKDGMKTKDLVWEKVELSEDFKKTEETPTLHTLNFKDGSVKYLFISGRPGWSNLNNKGQGFFATTSDDGINWKPFENFFGEDAKREKYKAKKGTYNPIVAMASMVQVREDGEFVDKWDFLFHDYTFRVFKTRLTFNENNEMEFSTPEPFMEKYESDYQKKYSFCEPCMFRNPENLDQIIVIFRANKKISNSFIAVSNDNGKTFETPKELPNYLTGERHKMVYLGDGKVAISFRKIDFYGNIKKKSYFYSHGTMMWIGKIDDLLSLSKEDKGILLKVFHTYLTTNENYSFDANADTGYCGLYSKKDKDGNTIVIISSYGRILADDQKNTVIDSKIINVTEIEHLITTGQIKAMKK